MKKKRESREKTITGLGFLTYLDFEFVLFEVPLSLSLSGNLCRGSLSLSPHCYLGLFDSVYLRFTEDGREQCFCVYIIAFAL